MPMYEPGETVTLIGDVFPGNVAVLEPVDPEKPDAIRQVQLVPDPQRPGTMIAMVPQGLPQNTQAYLFRVIITPRGLVVGYQSGGEVHRVELPAVDTNQVTYQGGIIGDYQVTMRGDCRCKARMLSTWDLSQIFPGHPVEYDARKDQVIAAAKAGATYGTIPQRGVVRYSRV